MKQTYKFHRELHPLLHALTINSNSMYELVFTNCPANLGAIRKHGGLKSALTQLSQALWEGQGALDSQGKPRPGAVQQKSMPRVCHQCLVLNAPQVSLSSPRSTVYLSLAPCATTLYRFSPIKEWDPTAV